jgi:hypothetical protein
MCLRKSRNIELLEFISLRSVTTDTFHDNSDYKSVTIVL